MTEKKQAYNPYMPQYEYVPDGEPHVVGDRVYVYGSHDRFDGWNFCLNNYVCYSAPLNDLGNWKYEGEILRREQDPEAKGMKLFNGMAAPDMLVGPDGKFYLYYFIGGTKMISVAVCDEPAGKYEFYGYVHYEDGTPIGKEGGPLQFDPGIFLDDDGRLYLYTGFGLKSNPIILEGSKPSLDGPMCYELDPFDMLTVKSGPMHIGVCGENNSKGSGYEGHEFLEASSMRKFEGKYYFIYSSLLSHELCYAVSDSPTKGFQYGGTLVSNGDIGLEISEGENKGKLRSVHTAVNDTGNTHGSVVKLNDSYYVFYHRQTNRKQSSRQACAEKIKFENGKFNQAQMTSCGLNDGPLKGSGIYPSYICCNLYGKKGTKFLSMIKRFHFGVPYLTQDEKDYFYYGGDHTPIQYVKNICDGSVVGYKYFDLSKSTAIRLKVKGSATGRIEILNDNRMLGCTDVNMTEAVNTIEIAFTPKSVMVEADEKTGIVHKEADDLENSALYIKYFGRGHFSLLEFELL